MLNKFKILKHLFLYFLLIGTIHNVQCQSKDSLYIKWEDTTLDDSIRFISLSQHILRGMLPNNPDSALILAKVLLDSSVLKKHDYFQGVAIDLTGLVYAYKGEIKKAVIYYMNALKIFDKIGSHNGRAIAAFHLGDLYVRYKDSKQAKFYFFMALDGFEQANQPKKVAAVMNSLGWMYMEQKDWDSAVHYYNRSLILKQELKDKSGIANTLNNLGLIYYEKGNYQKSRQLHQEAYDIMVELNDNNSMAIFYNNIGNTFSAEKDFARGVKYSQKAYEISKKTGILETQYLAAHSTYLAYKNLGQYKQAFEILEEYKALSDSLERNANVRELLNQKYKYEYELKSTADSITFTKDLIIKESELQVSKVRQIVMLLALLVLTFGGIVIYQKYGVMQKQRDTIQIQKSELEKKNKAVLDSIIYAEKIQHALLPSAELISSLFPQHFVLYKPKDIVAGDFYWVEKTGNKILFAVADCTGHGVPGSLVSVICIAGLRSAVKELALFRPSEILNHTREFILNQFQKSEEQVNDGMDISLACYDPETKILEWAGAFNPLIIIRKGELISLRADRFPVGSAPVLKPFTNHSFPIYADDLVYLYSDGFADQFNSETGKKFTSRQLHSLLLSLENLPLNEQHQEILRTFDTWKGLRQQVDDVCVMGIRFSHPLV